MTSWIYSMQFKVAVLSWIYVSYIGKTKIKNNLMQTFSYIHLIYVNLIKFGLLNFRWFHFRHVGYYVNVHCDLTAVVYTCCYTHKICKQTNEQRILSFTISS